jgi:type IV secretory pathway TraG/TraD family ATPase VirD4
MVRSAIEQGMSVVLYEYKADDDGRGGQMEFLATLAARHGYKLNVFAPGRDYSCTINPLDFIANEADDTTATVLAEVFHKNLKGEAGKSDAFFSAAGQRLIQALLQFAKSTRFPDLAMAFAVARLPKLGERLLAADARGSLPMPVQIAFSQFMQAAGAQKTASGIIATASDVLTRFMSSRILPSLLGNTNVSLQLGQREMIVFQSDIFRQDAINPILAAIITVLVNRNFSIQRDTPLLLCLDEFPTLVLPQAPTWPNEHRSKGFIGLFGFQSFPQVRERYGRERSDILLSGVGSHFWFNPGNHETAKALSQFLGEKEITIKQKSRSYSRGGGGSSSTSTSEQTRTRPLILPDEFLRFGTGECVVLNPAYRDKKASNLPQHFRQIHIPQQHLALVHQCEELWGAEVLPALRERELSRRPHDDLEGLLRQRFDEAERLLPLPDNNNENDGDSNKPNPGYKLADL